MADNINQALVKLNRAALLHDEGDFDGAISIYTQLLEEHPNSRLLHFQRGITYLDRRDYDNAILDLTRVIEFNRSGAGAYVERGDAYQRKGQLDLAIADYNQAIQLLTPTLALAFNSRGAAHRMSGDFDDAVRDLTLAGQVDVTYAAPHVNLAGLYFNSGRPAEALPHLDRASQLDPQEPAILRLRADVEAALQHTGGQGEVDGEASAAH